MLHRELAPVYLPFSLADLKVKAEVSTERGKGLVYQETQDWVCPENSLFDIRVLDRLEPWNFDEIEPLDPALCKGNPEENIRIVAPSNLQPRGRIIDALLYDRVRDGVMDGFGAGKVDIRRWSYDFHKLDHIALLLPIFFAETPPDPWGNRIATAINGQTGAAAACLRLQEGKRTMMTGRGISVRTCPNIPSAPLSWRYAACVLPSCMRSCRLRRPFGKEDCSGKFHRGSCLPLGAFKIILIFLPGASKEFSAIIPLRRVQSRGESPARTRMEGGCCVPVAHV